MKKATIYLMITCLSLAFCPGRSYSENIHSPIVVSKQSESEKANALLLRLNEISDMDKSNLKVSDKRNLRKEVRSIKQQLSEIGGGVYISVGGLIIIILLLIILF